MTHDTIVALAVLGIAGQATLAAFAVLPLPSLANFTSPFRALRSTLWG